MDTLRKEASLVLTKNNVEITYKGYNEIFKTYFRENIQTS